MEAPPAKKARTERPPFALFKQLAKEELDAADANLRRLRTNNVMLQEAANRAIKDMVEVMEKLAANKADLKAAEEDAGRLRMAPALTSREAPRPLPPGAPGEEGLCPEHVFCGPDCALRWENRADWAFPAGARSSDAAVSPFASGGLEPMS